MEALDLALGMILESTILDNGQSTIDIQDTWISALQRNRNSVGLLLEDIKDKRKKNERPNPRLRQECHQRN